MAHYNSLVYLFFSKNIFYLSFPDHQKCISHSGFSFYKVPALILLGGLPVTMGQSCTIRGIWNLELQHGPGKLSHHADPEVFTELPSGPCG